MHLAIATLALQLHGVAFSGSDPARTQVSADSLRDVERARSAQADFERARRQRLPWEPGSGGRCDVRVGRYCWWYEEESPKAPAEPPAIAERRAELLRELDGWGRRYAGDDWLAAARVHYLLEARRERSADSVARACGGTPWWCNALLGYAAHVAGDAAGADSAFRRAFAQMPEALRCRWTDIHALLPGDTRERYESLPCDRRAAIERRYWLLGRPRLSAPANEWQVEFWVRRVQSWLAERSVSPHGLRWGEDAEELVLRYGWPTRWGRTRISSAGITEASIVGHDPSPSFAFGPREALLDTLAASGNDGWELSARNAESRVALRSVRRVAPLSAQLARFQRGDSTLVVASYAFRDDSVTKPEVRLAVALDDETTVAASPDTTGRGVRTLAVAGTPRLASVELSDSAAGVLGRHRMLYRPDTSHSRLMLSDLLLLDGGAVATLDSAIVRAIPGDTVARSRPLGLFWETYGLADGGESVDVAVSVERIDNGFFRAARQRLGLEEKDTPLRLQWSDTPSPVSRFAPRSVSLDLANLPAGRYRVALSVTPQNGGVGGVPTASREIELVER